MNEAIWLVVGCVLIIPFVSMNTQDRDANPAAFWHMSASWKSETSRWHNFFSEPLDQDGMVAETFADDAVCND